MPFDTGGLCTILVCSLTGERLRFLGDDELLRVNAWMREGRVRHRGGDAASRPLEGGLVAAQAGWVYPIYNDLPYLLPEDALVVAL